MKYGVYAKNENTLHGRVQGWELIETFETEAAAKKELEEYYIPENENMPEEEKCELKVDLA